MYETLRSKKTVIRDPEPEDAWDKKIETEQETHKEEDPDRQDVKRRETVGMKGGQTETAERQ